MTDALVDVECSTGSFRYRVREYWGLRPQYLSVLSKPPSRFLCFIVHYWPVFIPWILGQRHIQICIYMYIIYIYIKLYVCMSLKVCVCPTAICWGARLPILPYISLRIFLKIPMQVALSNPGLFQTLDTNTCAQSFPPAALRSLLLLERHAAAPGKIEHSCVKGGP